MELEDTLTEQITKISDLIFSKSSTLLGLHFSLQLNGAAMYQLFEYMFEQAVIKSMINDGYVQTHANINRNVYFRNNFYDNGRAISLNIRDPDASDWIYGYDGFRIGNFIHYHEKLDGDYDNTVIGKKERMSISNTKYENSQKFYTILNHKMNEVFLRDWKDFVNKLQ